MNKNMMKFPKKNILSVSSSISGRRALFHILFIPQRIIRAASIVIINIIVNNSGFWANVIFASLVYEMFISR